MKKKIITIIVLLINALIIATTILIITSPKEIIKNYEVKGIDVSNYQGEVEWNIIAKEDIKFAFIKATEGENYVDSYFSKNYQEAKNTGLVLGAYHFFDAEADGEKQADNFINTVGELSENEFLLPIVDVEFYNKQNPEPDTIRKELTKFLSKVEKKYKISPIIYVTQKSYKKYIAENFHEYDIWVRNVWTKPKIENDKWTFWQYTDKAKLQGYQGKEKYIDLNVYNGTKDQFKGYIQQKQLKRKDELEKEKPKIESVRGVITKIEENKFTIQIGENDFRELEITNEKKIYNRRTEQEISISQIKEQDTIEISKIIKIEEKYSLLDEADVYVTKNLHGEELKKELLNQKELPMGNYEIKNNKNGTITLTGNITDYYGQQGESFLIDVIITSNTLIMGNTENQLEKLQKLRQGGDTLYVTLQEKKQNGKLIAKNIEILGC